VIAHIVIKKFISEGKESVTIKGVYSTKEAADEKVVELVKKSMFHNIRYHVISKQIKGIS
jgi:hypothetical protein